jgi:rhamnose transport system substrate-binding protein
MKMNSKMFISLLLVIAVLSLAPLAGAQDDDAVVAEPGLELDMVLIPKFLGILVFDQAHAGAMEAHEELENSGELVFVGPGPGEGADAQVPYITTATTQGVDAIMISNNGGEVTGPSSRAALDEGIAVVSWDSPMEPPESEVVFIAQVDFDETGKVMADMALSLLGEEGGQFAILSATPDASNQNAWIAAMQEVLETDETYANLELVDIVYGNDQSEDSYNEALGLVDRYPDLQLIMAPTTVGIAAAAQAIQHEGLCGEVLVSGLGLPAEMQGFVEAGCAQEFALWSFHDLGYLTYYVSYLLASGALEGEVGETFEAGRMGTYTIEADPTREDAKRVLMGPFSLYNVDNLDEWALTEEELEELEEDDED